MTEETVLDTPETTMNTRAPALLTMGQRHSIDKVATIKCYE